LFAFLDRIDNLFEAIHYFGTVVGVVAEHGMGCLCHDELAAVTVEVGVGEVVNGFIH
jgi:hypothetical protein